MFKNMTLARWIILLSFLGSIALAVTGVMFHQERKALEAALETEVPRRAQEIQILGQRYTQLHAKVQREGWVGTENPESYVRKIAADPKVRLGQVKIVDQSGSSPARGVVDNKYVVRPQDRDRAVDRLRIANFAWKLENESSRVKVTGLRLDPERKMAEWEHAPDAWSWEIELTSRQKVEAN